MTGRKTAIAAAGFSAGMLALLGALQSVAWNGSDAPLVARMLVGLLDPGLLLEPAARALEQPTESYFGYGRLVLGAYGLLLLAAYGLRRHLPPLAGTLTSGLLGLAALADFVAYWISESHGPGLRRIAFWYTEVPALCAVVLLLSAVGVLRLRHEQGQGQGQGRTTRWLALCLPISLATTALLGYLPHGMLLGLALTLTLTLFVAEPHDSDRELAPQSGSRLRPGAVSLGCVAAFLFLALLYRPILRPGPEIPPTSITMTEGLEGATLHVFNTGYNRMSWWLVGRERPWRPVPAFVVEHPQSGLFIFDTGFPEAVGELGEDGLEIPERWVIESISSPEMMLPAQMRAAGLDPSAVHHVVISHLHGDHIGQLQAFPNAQIIGGFGSRQAIQSHFPSPEFRERFQELSFQDAERFGPFDQAVSMPGNQGIIPTRGGGHTREDLMLLLSLDEGPLLLAGDAAVHAEWLVSNDVQRIPVDADRAAVVRNQIRSLRASMPRLTIAFGHDLREIDCTRRDIECHREDRFHPEALSNPQP